LILKRNETVQIRETIMTDQLNKDNKWQLIYEDTFSHERSVDKQGSDLAEGFYKLWFYTLLESVTEISQNVNGELKKVPGKGFNFFTLIFEINNENRKLEINVDKNLQCLFGLKKLLLGGYDGRKLAAGETDAMVSLADSHAMFIFAGKEEIFYSGMEQIVNSPNLNLVSFNIKLSALLNKHNLKLTAPSAGGNRADSDGTLPPTETGKE